MKEVYLNAVYRQHWHLNEGVFVLDEFRLLDPQAQSEEVGCFFCLLTNI